MKWTEKQQRAIEARDKNILVAAAAGSGKTAVLVERIKNLVLEERCPIDRMLIVTFTNAAASEMKEKIEKAIKGAIEQVPGVDLQYLKKQLELMASANISTFHSFALDVIRRYFYIIDIEPNFKICDNVQSELIKQDAFSTLLEKLYEEGSQDFFDFLDSYSGDRKDDTFIDIISSLYATIQSLPEPFLWLSEAVESLNCDEEDFNDSKAMKAIWRETEKMLAEAVAATQRTVDYGNKVGHPGAIFLGTEDGVYIRELLDLVEKKKYDDISRRIREHRFTPLSAKYKKPKDCDLSESELLEAENVIKYNRGIIKDKILDDLKSDFFYGTLKEQWENVKDTYHHGKFLQRAVTMYDEIFKGLKADKGLVDFNDIEHFALEILKDREAASFYRDKFKHIFIDEYQDSNIIQEALIGTIKRDNNLFMVGDVKQSIYKFRLAEPEIFQRKYALYKTESEEKGDAALSEKIDLNQNFRSKEKIINFINKVFETTMEGYDKDAALYLGDPNGEKCPYEPMLYLVDETSRHSDSQEDDDEIKNLEKAEKEALAAVKIIRDNLGKTIYDSKKNTERPLEMRDIVILMRAIKSQGDVFSKVLTDNGIAAYVDDDTGFFDSFEVNTVVALLSILDNPKQEIPLITVLRSEIFGFKIKELAEIKLNMKYGSFYDGFMAYSCGKVGCKAIEDYKLDSSLAEKCRKARETLEKWRELARVIPLNELIWNVLLESGFYVVMGAMPAGSQRQANLRALVDKSIDYAKGQEGSLFGFIKFIEAIKSNKVSMGQVKLLGEDDDTVRIMTIHKSKGLEFPMVILAGYCRQLNYTKVGKTIGIHKDIGIALRKVNHSEGWFKTTLPQNAIKALIKKEEEAEEKRVLYVAMTRTIDMLYILGTGKNVTDLLEKVSDKVPSTTDYFSMTGKRIFCDMGKVRVIESDQIADVSKGKRRTASRIVSLLTEKKLHSNGHADPLTEKIRNNLSYVYPQQEELGTKSKYSVSELNSKVYKNVSLAEPMCFKLRDTFTPAQIGTITHKVLEKLDFAAACQLEEKEIEPYIHRLIQQMIGEEFISEEEAEVVNVRNIEIFLKSSLGKRIGKSKMVAKEQTFNIKWVVDDKDAIVQGIIDCFFEEDGEMVLVDYKTSNINSDKEFEAHTEAIAETYKTQISIYKKAIEESTGKKVKEAFLYLTNIGKAINM